jgi:hypothetical protein
MVAIGKGAAIEQLFDDGNPTVQFGRLEHGLGTREAARGQMGLHGLYRGEARLRAGRRARHLDHDTTTVGELYAVNTVHARRKELVALDGSAKRAHAELIDTRRNAARIVGAEDLLLQQAAPAPGIGGGNHRSQAGVLRCTDRARHADSARVRARARHGDGAAYAAVTRLQR